MKKVYLILITLIVLFIAPTNAQLLQWNTFGNTGLETSEPSTTNNANISAASLTQGSITPAGNGNRFGGNGWWNTGNSTNSTLAEAVAGNDYIQFIVTPNTGFSFTPTSFVFNWDRSTSGPTSVTLRSSVDGFVANLGSVTAMPAAISVGNTITITGLTDLTTATTFRLYGYGGTATTGTGGFDVTTSVVNVALNGTTASAGAPSITVSTTNLSGFTSLSGAPSTEQTYTVEGSNLTNDIIITPPVGYEISLTSGAGFISNPSTLNLTPTAGTVATTTIYVRMNSATLGSNTGSITNASTGATTRNVALSGNVIAVEPTLQGGISFGTVDNSSIVVNFTSGDGAKQILLVKAVNPVDNNPVDGTTYTASATFGAGSQLPTGNFAVYAGTSGGTVTVTGLTVSTTYHFALYEYNDGGVAGAENYLLTAPATGNATTTNVSNSYTWIGLNGAWTTATNWLPTRTSPATNDILQFTDGNTVTVTAVPNQSIGQINISNNTRVTLQAAATNTSLNIGGNSGLDLTVSAGSQLNIDGSNNYTLNLLTGTTASVEGTITFTGGSHRLLAADASAINFNNGAVFTAGTGFAGNAFGNTTANAVIFTNGSTYVFTSGSNPFSLTQPASVVVFQTGSLYRHLSILTPSVSGRTYANFELNAIGAAFNLTGGGAFSVDNLIIIQGSMNLNLTGAMSVKGNINVAPGATLGFVPATVTTLSLNGTTAQSIINNGTFNFGSNVSLTINNSNGITLNNSITLGATTTLTLTAGILKLSPSTVMVTLSAGTTLAGVSNTSYIDGLVKKIGNTAFVFPVGKTGFGYVPIAVSNFVGGAVTDELVAEYRRGNARLLGPVTAVGLDHVSGCDYWTLNLTNGTPTVDLTLNWSTNNVCFGTYIDDLPTVTVAHFDGSNWDSYAGEGTATGTNAAGSITRLAVNIFGTFSLGSVSTLNPLPITINYFTGTKQNNGNLLNWKITCTNTPSVTILVERSQDGNNFDVIQTIQATAIRCAQPFNYTDLQAKQGMNFYRLKVTDANGKTSYSSTVALSMNGGGFDVISIAPNPVTQGNLKLNFITAKISKMEIQIADLQGRVVYTQSKMTLAGTNLIPINVSQLAAGTYQITAIMNGKRTIPVGFIKQ